MWYVGYSRFAPTKALIASCSKGFQRTFFKADARFVSLFVYDSHEQTCLVDKGVLWIFLSVVHTAVCSSLRPGRGWGVRVTGGDPLLHAFLLSCHHVSTHISVEGVENVVPDGTTLGGQGLRG